MQQNCRMIEKRGAYKGVFAVFEGPDGSGKLTQAKEIQEYIQQLSKYVDVITTHEPWKSAEIKRKLERDKDAYSDGILLSELFVDDRVKHTKHLIRPVLDAGGILLCDRYKMSTCAYQWVQGVDLHQLLELHEDRGILTPDITFLMQINPGTTKERIKIRGGDIEKFERNEQFTKKLINAYAALGHMAQVDEKIFGKVIMIDANRTPAEISVDVKKAFQPVYEKWAQQNLFERFGPETINSE